MPNSTPPRGRCQERTRVNPEEVWESAKKRVLGLEAAISAMIANGIDERSSEVTSLKDSLAKAKRNAQEPSVSIQLKGAKEFVERARKRLVAHDAQRAVLEKELVDGETRVQRLEVEASVVCPRSTELDAEVSQLKVKLAMMEAEQQRLREGAARSLHAEQMTDEVPSVAGIPPLPQHAEEVEQWFIDRNCELRSALHYQDTPMIAHIGALIAKGASKFSNVESGEGQSRSSHDCPNFQCRCQKEVCQGQSVPFHDGGLRGLRIGEASHPGPRLLRRYRGSRRGVVVTSSDDDDAPLLSEGLRRNVVPRVAGSASVADFGQTIVSRESTQFPLEGVRLGQCAS